MASDAMSSQGILFYRWHTTSPTGWVSVAEITGVDGPTKSRETLEVTTLDSTEGYREHIPGLREGGTVALAMNFFRDTYDTMNDDFEDDTVQNYLIAIPDDDNTMMEFAGMVTEIPFSAAVGAVITANVTIKVTGKVYTFSGISSVPESASSPADIEG